MPTEKRQGEMKPMSSRGIRICVRMNSIKTVAELPVVVMVVGSTDR
jgi:hypothetical protein